MSCSGCANSEQIAEPRYMGSTNEDHLHYTLDLRGALRECNASLEALRRWSDEQ